MRGMIRVFLGLAACFFSASGLAEPLEVAVPVPGVVPFAFLEKGEPKGLIGEVTRMAFKNMGVEVRFSEMPFARMYKSLEDGALAGGVSALRTPDREKTMFFSKPIMVEYNVILVKKGKAWAAKTTADLAGKRIGSRIGFKYPLIDGVSGVSLEPVDTHETNFKKLAGGRIDGLIIGSITGVVEATTKGFMKDFEVLPIAFGKVPLGTAFSRKKFSEKQVEQFDAEVEKIKAGQDWAAIVARNEVSDLMKEWPVAEK